MENTSSNSLEQKIAIAGSRLSVNRFNYDISTRVLDLILQTSRQGGLLALAMIASATIWSGHLSDLWSKIWLSSLLVSAVCSVIFHFGITSMHMSIEYCRLGPDHQLIQPENDEILFDPAFKISVVFMSLQSVTLAAPFVAVLIGLIF
ncbi:MAG: hypothetical protein JJ916_03330 [Phycisphaerales bacterium]|nr:hypothetical protein [Phycisphaerales bacterium]